MDALNKRKILLKISAAVFFSVILVVGLVIPIVKLFITKAALNDNVSGFAWSSNIGWISFNSKNCDANSDGFSDGTPPAPIGCPSGGTAIYQYGVNIDASGDFTAGSYAWTEHLGAIDFNPAGPYPGLPNYPAQLDWLTRQVSGWARACDVFQTSCSGALKADSERGGWDGWIKLRKDASDAGADYGVSIFNDNQGDFHGYAWGFDVVGWISFNCLEGSSSGGSVCDTSSYKVSMSNPPEVRYMQAPSIDYCDTRVATFQWEYFDPEGQDENWFEFQVDNDSDFSSPNFSRSFDSVSFPSPTTQRQPVMLSTDPADNACFPTCNRIGYNTTYYWRVRVRDSSGTYSTAPGTQGPSFTTLLHAFPSVTSISVTPSVPSANENVSFSAVTVCYNTSGPTVCPSGTPGATAPASGYHWSFPGGNPATVDGNTNPTTQFTTAGAVSVSLKIIDSDGYGDTCSAQGNANFRIQLPLPGWKEISP